MFDTLAILDVETTGMSPVRDRIIEIGILRIEKGRLVDAFESLVNPECHLPPEITVLTGIHGMELENAPTFYHLKGKIRELLTDAVFVAHNARFDYSFIKSEFARHEESFTSKVLCTARLSRMLYPGHRHHNLDSIIERLGVICEARHRALGDAKVLWEFLKYIEKSVNPEKIGKALAAVSKTFSLPPGISKEMVANLPESPGVYTFYNQDGAPIYIGKSINLKERILSHFSEATRSVKEGKVFQSVRSIDVQETQGELEALLVESRRIKQYKPLYNRQLRDAEKLTVLFKEMSRRGYCVVNMKDVSTIHPDEIGSIMGIFRSHGQAKKHLTDLAKDHALCKKFLALESGSGACFGYQLETCHGACIGKESAARYNIRFVEAFNKTKLKQWPFPGPIAVREGNAAHVISHWCYMGKMGESEYYEESRQPKVFDYDTYKILTRYLLRTSTGNHVRVLKFSTGSEGI